MCVQASEMEVDQVGEVDQEESISKMEIVDAPCNAPPTSGDLAAQSANGSAGQEGSPSAAIHAAIPLSQPSPSSITGAPSKVPPAQVSRGMERLTVASAGTPTLTSAFGGTPSSAGLIQRTYVPNWQYPLAVHTKSAQLSSPHNQTQGGLLSLGRASPPANLTSGPSVLGSSTAPGILPRPSVTPILPPGRSGPAASLYPARPAGPSSGRFPPPSSLVSNSGDPAATAQGHMDMSNRKVVLQGVPQTP